MTTQEPDRNEELACCFVAGAIVVLLAMGGVIFAVVQLLSKGV